jgi:hypothetical protein
MRYIILLLIVLLFPSCKGSQVVTPAIEVQAPDSLPDPASANGWVFVRTSVKGGLYVPPKPVGKQKFKNVGNDYSKVKDAGNYTDKSSVKDKSKVKEKVKADIIGDGNQLDKSKKGLPSWVAWLAILLALLFVIWPKIRKFWPF